MQENDQSDFLPLTAKHSLVLTWLFNFLGVACLVALFFFLACLPFLISQRMEVVVIMGLVYYPLWFFSLYRLIRYIKMKMAGAIRTISVDDQGIHFENKDGSATTLYYSELGPTYRSHHYDVYLVPVNKKLRLVVGLAHREIRVVFDGTDKGSVYYITNARALRARFIAGIVRFRPDLRIDPTVYNKFSIHPQTFGFDGKQYGKNVALGAAILASILLFSLLLAFLLTAVS
ncbi:hypothetical protein ACKUSY_02470 [Myroides odoratus]